MRDDAALAGDDSDGVAYEPHCAPQTLIGCAAAVIGARRAHNRDA